MARVMIVDDNENIRIAYREVLKTAGHEVFIAQNAIEAYGIMKDNKIEVAVVDVMLGNESGIDLLKAMRRDRKDIEVIIITGKPSMETVEQAFEDEAFVYLIKPVNAKEMRKMVAKAVEKRNSLLEN